jgi:DNA polymerase-1
MSKSFFLIDGHAQIYRAYFAPFGNLTSPTGEPTRATHVFSQMVLNLLRDRKPDYLAVAMDVSDETVFRKDFYPEYKAHRDPPPEDLPRQADRIVQILKAARIPILRMQRWEADDIMATLARRHARSDLHVYFVSKDKDLQQLLNENVSLYDPGKDEVISATGLVELKGWPPELAVEAQCLMGDTVDNVPGVKGIGEKTAAKLIQKYGSAKGVIEHADELTPKQRENVLAFAPQLEITRKLVTLRDDVPIEFDLEAAAVGRFAWSAVKPIFQELGFKRLPEQLPEERHEGTEARRHEGEGGSDRGREELVLQSRIQNPKSKIATEDLEPQVGTVQDAVVDPSRQTDPVEEAAAAQYMDRNAEVVGLRAAVDASLLARFSKPDGGDYRLVNTREAFEDLARRLAEQTAFAVDTETTGVNPVDADLVGVSVAWELGRGYYVPTQSFYGDALPIELVREKLSPILANPRSLKAGHNLKYDLIVLRQAGMPVAGPMFDTMIAAFVLDPMQTSYGMNTLVTKLLSHTMIPITDLIGKGRDQLRMDQVPLAQVAEYAAEDADYTWRMKELFEPAIRRSDLAPLFHNTEIPLVSVLTEMEFNGISLDAPFLAAMGKKMAARAEQLGDEVFKHAGQRFNLDSPKQLGEILFDKLGMRVVRKTRTTRSTDAETLEVLAKETAHPMLALLLEYRELQKLRGTYVDALPGSRSKRTGRVHTSFHQTGAVTGRLSSSEPNLQNIPIRTEAGREIRRAFVPRTPNERLIVADYSQVELRVLAHYSEDEELIRAFQEDRDIHAFVAAQINNVPLEQVTREMRGRAKAVNFGLIYGQTAFGLAQGTGMSRTEAQAFIDAYFRRYPRIRGFIQQCIATARREGAVRTMLGRRRPILDIDSRNQAVRAQGERLAVNTVIQGSAADLIKIAMINLDRRIRTESLPLRMLLQVHDELVCEGPLSEAPRLAEILRTTMSGAMSLRVPLKVDVAIGENWLEAK